MKSFIKEEFKCLMARSLFVAMAAMALVLWSPAGDTLQDIWQSPGRLEAIENDINEINERLTMFKLDENRAIAATNP